MSRYEVVSIEGYDETTHYPRLSVWIADSCYGFRPVETWRESKTLHRVTCVQKALYRCDELNAADEAWVRGDKSVGTVDEAAGDEAAGDEAA